MDSEAMVQNPVENEIDPVLQADVEPTLATSQHHLLSLQTLTIADCAALADQIRQILGEGASVVLDLSDCQEVDTAGIQLLVTIQNDPSVNLRVHWTQPAEIVAMKAARLGVQAWITAGLLEH